MNLPEYQVAHITKPRKFAINQRRKKIRAVFLEDSSQGFHKITRSKKVHRKWGNN